MRRNLTKKKKKIGMRRTDVHCPFFLIVLFWKKEERVTVEGQEIKSLIG